MSGHELDKRFMWQDVSLYKMTVQERHVTGCVTVQQREGDCWIDSHESHHQKHQDREEKRH